MGNENDETNLRALGDVLGELGHVKQGSGKPHSPGGPLPAFTPVPQNTAPVPPVTNIHNTINIPERINITGSEGLMRTPRSSGEFED